ncbi:hypothetical protein B5X24_HaOG200764 [Helicoverpa armigera]|uniref:Gustatory receptor n=1 Tax=Helicoverpa armigera TaxID=29058 RepID=A0A2W1BY00_HELAM|nr:hypothetical protein B5X24_HaOG200764 [Helicoverpa armigera]
MEFGKDQDNESNIDQDYSNQRKKIVNIYNNIKRELIFEYFTGIYRFQLIDGELRTPNWKLKALGIVIVSIYTAAFIWFIIPDPSDCMTGLHVFLNNIDDFPCIVVLIQYIASMITCNFLMNSKNIRSITLLGEVDTILQVEKIEDFYKKIESKLNKYLILLILTHFIHGVLDVFSSDDIVWEMTILPLYLNQKIVVLIFCSYVIMLNSRLRLINSYLREFIQEQDKRSVPVFTVRGTKTKNEKTLNYIGRPSIRNTKIRDLATTYDIMGEICFMVNEIFNFQIFISLVTTFTFIVITIWTSLNVYRKPDYQSSQLINVLIWCMNMICNVAAMSFACERLLVLRNETRILVNKIIMNYNLPKTVRVQAKAFMELVEAWPLRIYVYDMFSIDITLMLKFISVATTYLIVLIQISHFI